MIRSLDVDAIHLRDWGLQDVKDPVWIPKAAVDGRKIITLDKKMSTRALEARALSSNGAVAFFLSSAFGDLMMWPQAYKIIKYWPEIEKYASTSKAGDVFDVAMHGKISRR
jgi:PIN like domain